MKRIDRLIDEMKSGRVNAWTSSGLAGHNTKELLWKS